VAEVRRQLSAANNYLQQLKQNNNKLKRELATRRGRHRVPKKGMAGSTEGTSVRTLATTVIVRTDHPRTDPQGLHGHRGAGPADEVQSKVEVPGDGGSRSQMSQAQGTMPASSG
jgi:hypothetical protein